MHACLHRCMHTKVCACLCAHAHMRKRESAHAHVCVCVCEREREGGGEGAIEGTPRISVTRARCICRGSDLHTPRMEAVTNIVRLCVG